MRQMLNLPVDVITHLKGHDNMSAYVTRLVRQDKAESFEDKVKRIVEQALAKNGAIAVTKNTLNEEISGSIFSILNI